MTPELLEYFQRELQFLKSAGPQFAHEYPDIGPKLDGSAYPPADPHVERLIQAVALLNGRVHLHLDHDQDRLIESILEVMFPHTQRPVPSCAVVQFAPDPADAGYEHETVIPRGTLLRSDPIRDICCQFQTAYAVEMRPFGIQAGGVLRGGGEAPGGLGAPRATIWLRIGSLRPGQPLPVHGMTRLRLFLQAARPLSCQLYERMVQDSIGLTLTGANGRTWTVPGRGLVSGAGFGPQDALLPWPIRSPVGQRLLLEFCAFPEKFLFVDVEGFNVLDDADVGSHLDLRIYCDKPPRELEGHIAASSFQLHCTPAVNLFPQRAEPIRLTHERAEYVIRPDVRGNAELEVYAVDEIAAAGEDRTIRLPEFHEPRFPHAPAGVSTSWFAVRRAHHDRTRAARMHVSLCDPRGELLSADRWTLDITTHCLNGNLPSVLPYHGKGPRLWLPGSGHSPGTCVVPPTARLPPMVPETCIAGLVRLLALQSLPLFAEQAPASRLQEVLDFCNSGRTRESESARDGIAGVQTEVVMEALSVGTARCFCRGLEVAIDFDESRYPGGSVFLFASVLEHYLGLSSGLNWFTRLVARSLATRQVLHRFKSRADHEAFSSTV